LKHLNLPCRFLCKKCFRDTATRRFPHLGSWNTTDQRSRLQCKKWCPGFLRRRSLQKERNLANLSTTLKSLAIILPWLLIYRQIGPILCPSHSLKSRLQKWRAKNLPSIVHYEESRKELSYTPTFWDNTLDQK
jgi:hypothetical protein